MTLSKLSKSRLNILKKIKNKNYFVIVSKKKNKYLMTYKHELGPLKEFINFPIFVKKNSIKNSIKKNIITQKLFC